MARGSLSVYTVSPRVSEVAALQIPDVRLSTRRSLLTIYRGKDLKHREITLVQETCKPLTACLIERSIWETIAKLG